MLIVIFNDRIDYFSFTCNMNTRIDYFKNEVASIHVQNMTRNTYGLVAYSLNRIYSAMAAHRTCLRRLWVRFPLYSTIPGLPG